MYLKIQDTITAERKGKIWLLVSWISVGEVYYTPAKRLGQYIAEEFLDCAFLCLSNFSCLKR